MKRTWYDKRSWLHAPAPLSVDQVRSVSVSSESPPTRPSSLSLTTIREPLRLTLPLHPTRDNVETRARKPLPNAACIVIGQSSGTTGAQGGRHNDSGDGRSAGVESASWLVSSLFRVSLCPCVPSEAHVFWEGGARCQSCVHAGSASEDAGRAVVGITICPTPSCPPSRRVERALFARAGAACMEWALRPGFHLYFYL